MAVRQYVGARYVPKFADPVAWQAGTSYEALTIVTYNNASYTSKIPVPATVGNPADNDSYWALTGNYNAQVEDYRQTTLAVQENLNNEITNRENADTALGERITQETNARTEAEEGLTNKINTNATNLEKPNIILLGDSWADPNSGITSQVAQAIKDGTKRTVLNYSVSGAYITNNGLGSQVTNAINAGTDKDSIYAIIIIMGVNDINNEVNPNTIASTVNTQIQRLHNYTNAPIFWFVNINISGTTSRYTLNYYTDLLRIYRYNVNGCSIISTFGLFRDWYTDWFHPSHENSAVLGYNICAIITGGQPTYYIQKFNLTYTGITVGRLQYYINDSIAHIAVTITPTETMLATTDSWTLDCAHPILWNQSLAITNNTLFVIWQFADGGTNTLQFNASQTGLKANYSYTIDYIQPV